MTDAERNLVLTLAAALAHTLDKLEEGAGWRDWAEYKAGYDEAITRLIADIEREREGGQAK